MASRWELIDVALPEYGLPHKRPTLDQSIYQARIARLSERTEQSGLDCVLVYADREHFANLAYLTGFDPRFEEALLILVPGSRPLLITGPENQSYADVSPIEMERVVYPPFGLLGQDRSKTPDLAELLGDAGLRRGWQVGVAGWKYFGDNECADPATWLETPAYIIDALRVLVGDGGVVNAGRIFMDSSDGLRATNEVDQLAQFEHAACHASEAVKRALTGLRPGLSEFEIAALMQLESLPLSCHPMCSSGSRTKLGLASPSDRIIAVGEPMQVAVGFWGALTCRAGWIASDEKDLPQAVGDYVERLAGPYFDCAAEWYEMIGIGVSGGEIDAMVKSRLGDPFFGVALNPGHLIHLDEWMNTPIFPGSTDTLRSGQAIQLDIIPATGTDYATANVEDGIALLDKPGRDAFRDKYPEAWLRIESRRAFLAETLGIRLKPEVLPFSNLAGCLAPFLLAPERVFARRK